MRIFHTSQGVGDYTNGGLGKTSTEKHGSAKFEVQLDRHMHSQHHTQGNLDSIYTSMRLQQLNEKAHVHRHDVLLEIFNDSTLNGMAKSLKALDAATAGYDLNLLRQGIRTASKEITSIMSGDKGGLLSRLKQLIVGNPITLAKIVAFEEAIINGMLQLPQVMTIITAGSDVKNDKPVIDTIDDEQRKNATNMIVKALQHPLRVFSSTKLPYIQGDLNHFAEQFLALTPAELTELSKRAGTLKRSVQDADMRKLAQQVHKQPAQQQQLQQPAQQSTQQQAANAAADQDASEETSGTKLAGDVAQATSDAAKSLGRGSAGKKQPITADQSDQIIAALNKLPLFAQKENDPIVEPIRKVIRQFVK